MKAWTALRDGGPRELSRRTRSWAARRISPPPPPRPSGSVPPAAASADNVSFAAATQFFRSHHGQYVRLADALAPHLDPDGVLFDIGANIGYFTKVLGRRSGFRGHVHLFEPVPHLAQLCLRTLQDSPYAVTLHRYGLGDSDAEVDIHVDLNGNFGWNTLITQKAHSDSMVRRPITIRRFDGIGLSVVPSAIKIDVEGAEYLVLRGLLPALRRWPTRPTILCEIGWGTGHPAWDEELAVFDELLALGYRCQTLTGEPVDVRAIARTTDVLFVAG